MVARRKCVSCVAPRPASSQKVASRKVVPAQPKATSVVQPKVQKMHNNVHNFDSLVMTKSGMGKQAMLDAFIVDKQNVFVLIGAEWCEPCKKTKNAIHAVAGEFPKLHFLIIDFDHHADPNLTDIIKKEEKGVPEVHLYKDGNRIPGIFHTMDNQQLRKTLKSNYR